MPELQRLRPEHEGAILAFERANRSYFSSSISDRGEEYFEHFPERHRELLDAQETGSGAFYVLVDEGGAILGRFNLKLGENGVAELGYRVAERVAGNGVATASVRELCSRAASCHGVRTVRAATSHQNVASQRVLEKAGFSRVGPADPSDIGGKEGSWFERHLTAEAG